MNRLEKSTNEDGWKVGHNSMSALWGHSASRCRGCGVTKRTQGKISRRRHPIASSDMHG